MPLPLVARSVRDLVLRRVRRGNGNPAEAAVDKPRSPDLFHDLTAWGKRNPELVATVALGFGALLGGKFKLIKAGVALMPSVVPKLIPKAS